MINILPEIIFWLLMLALFLFASLAIYKTIMGIDDAFGGCHQSFEDYILRPEPEDDESDEY